MSFGSDQLDLAVEIGAARLRPRAAPACDCSAAGTSARWRCRRSRRASGRAPPACCRAACRPGRRRARLARPLRCPAPRRRTASAAFESPTPGTDFLRARQRPHAVHASTSAAKSRHSSAAIGARRAHRSAPASRAPSARARARRGVAASTPDVDAARIGRGARSRHDGREAELGQDVVAVGHRRASRFQRARRAVAKRAAHHQRVFARRIGRGAADSRRSRRATGAKPSRLVERDRGDVRFAHFEKDLLGAEPSRVVDEAPQQRAAEPFAARVGHHRQIEDLRLARRRASARRTRRSALRARRRASRNRRRASRGNCRSSTAPRGFAPRAPRRRRDRRRAAAATRRPASGWASRGGPRRARLRSEPDAGVALGRRQRDAVAHVERQRVRGSDAFARGEARQRELADRLRRRARRRRRPRVSARRDASAG